MNLHRAAIALLTLAAFALSAATASAQTVLLKEDAEGNVEDNWVVNEPEDSNIKPWQKSDSPTPKLRGNQAHGGATSFWAGQSPPYDPVNVITGEATMQYKNPILIPADGKTTISFWSIWQNEGDDEGNFEVAVDTGGKPAWKKVAFVKLAPSALGEDYVPHYCDPSHPTETATEDWEEIKGDLGAYAGKKVLVRFNMKYGGENRSATQPCGWYVDDILMSTTGTPGNAGTAPTTAPAAPPAAAAPPAKATVKIGGFRIKGKKGTLALTVANQALSNVKVTLLKGRKKIGTGKAASLAPGARKVKIKLRKKLRKKTAYTVRITARAADGSAFKASGKTRDR